MNKLIKVAVVAAASAGSLAIATPAVAEEITYNSTYLAATPNWTTILDPCTLTIDAVTPTACKTGGTWIDVNDGLVCFVERAGDSLFFQSQYFDGEYVKVTKVELQVQEEKLLARCLASANKKTTAFGIGEKSIDDVSVGWADTSIATSKSKSGYGISSLTVRLTGPDYLEIVGLPDNYGTVAPGYGLTNGLAVGDSFACSAPACCTNAEETVVVTCRGYAVFTNGFVYVDGSNNDFRYTHPECTGGSKLVWQWEKTQYKLDIGVVGGGVVDVESQFAEPGSAFTVTATPDAGMKFWKWTGSGVTAENRYQSSVDVTMTEAKTLTANFYDPATTPRVVRYAKPSGTGTQDGTSWANAMTFAVAYTNAADLAKEDIPSEVWMQYGGYNVGAGNFVLQPNVVVRGGFVGTEKTADESDPEANPTLFYNNNFSVNAKWTDEARSKMWEQTDGRYFFFDPPVEGDASMYTDFSEFGDQKAFYRDDGAELGIVEFHGVSFSKFWGSAIRAVASCVKPIKLRKCRFLNINWLQNTENFVVQLTGVGVDMEDCEFVSACSPVIVKTAADDSPRLTASFNRCRFFTTRGCWYTRGLMGCTAGGIGALGNVQLTIRNSSFDRSVEGLDGNFALQNGTIVANTTCDLTIEDTVISRGRGSCYSSGGAVGWTPKGDARLEIRRCRFERCCYAGNGTRNVNEGAALTVLGSLANGRVIRGEIADTAFVGNYTAETSAEARGSSCVCFGSSCSGQTGDCDFTFLNCLFERNEAIHPLDGAAGTTVGNSGTQSPRLVFANCVFKDNVCGKIDANANTVYGTEFGREAATLRYAFVNTVFENSNKQVLPWPEAKSGGVCCANCVADTDVVFGDGGSNTYRYQPLVANDDAGLGALQTNGVVVARGLTNVSAYRRAGRPLWLGTDGGVYLYDATGDAAKPWRSCRYGGGRKTDEEAAAVGVSRAVAPIPDAFAKARSKLKTALGQLDFGVPGLILFLK